MTSRLTIGGTKLRFKEVVAVSFNTEGKISLEKATFLSRTTKSVKKGKKGPKPTGSKETKPAFAADTPQEILHLVSVSDLPELSYYSLGETRLILALALSWLMDRIDASVVIRPELLRFFEELFNNSVHLCIPRDISSIPSVLAAAASGNGYIVDHKVLKPLSGMEFPTISDRENQVLVSAHLRLFKEISFSSYNASVLLNLADAVCAASSDAIKASSFKSLSETSHKSLLVAYGNLEVLLKGSKMMNKSKRNIPDPLVFSQSVVVHGYARDQIQTSYRSLLVDVNSPSEEYDISSSIKSLSALISGMTCLACASRDRIKALMDPAFTSCELENVLFEQISEQCSELEKLADKASQSLKSFVTKFTSSDYISLAEEASEASQMCEFILLQELNLATLVLNIQERDLLKTFEESMNSDEGSKQRKPPKFTVGNGVSALREFVSSNPVISVCNSDCTKLNSFLVDIATASNENKKPKLPKGTRDFGAEQMSVREHVFSLIKSIFLKHGATGLDTPVFELRETLMGKYGEDSKLIYDLADQGGELLSLRYDLTVPFARYLAMNNVGNIKRYHISKVYRRDNVAIEKGRFREFYQCDFDIAGHYDVMIPDAEVLKVLCEILQALELQFMIKLNHRSFLDAFLQISGVPQDKFRPICSAIDKLDKMDWEQVKEEMIEKGLESEIADKVGEFVRYKGEPMALLDTLRGLESVQNHKLASSTLEEMELLFGYLQSLNVLQFVSFDLSLARGLNYYTGLIYEAILTDPKAKVGSIAAGGRYDGLVGIFCSKEIPSVGVSIGIERIFDIVLKREKERQTIKGAATQVLVASIGPDLTKERFELCSELWNADIPSEIVLASTPSSKKQLNHALKNKIPFILFIGEEELSSGMVNVKNTVTETQQTISRSDLIDYLKKHI